MCKYTVVWEIFVSKNISWVLATHENYKHGNFITTINYFLRIIKPYGIIY